MKTRRAVLGTLALLASRGVRANTEALTFASSSASSPTDHLRADQDDPFSSRTLQSQRTTTFDLHLGPAPSTELHLLALGAPPLSVAASWWEAQEEAWGLGMWTARLCWPASTPTDFDLSLSPSTPHGLPKLLVTAHNPRVPNPSAAQAPPQVAYTLLLEPVHLGIPASCLPLIGVLLGVLLALRGFRIPGRVADALELISRLEDDGAVKED